MVSPLPAESPAPPVAVPADVLRAENIHGILRGGLTKSKDFDFGNGIKLRAELHAVMGNGTQYLLLVRSPFNAQSSSINVDGRQYCINFSISSGGEIVDRKATLVVRSGGELVANEEMKAEDSLCDIILSNWRESLPDPSSEAAPLTFASLTRLNFPSQGFARREVTLRGTLRIPNSEIVERPVEKSAPKDLAAAGAEPEPGKEQSEPNIEFVRVENYSLNYSTTTARISVWTTTSEDSTTKLTFRLEPMVSGRAFSIAPSNVDSALDASEIPMMARLASKRGLLRVVDIVTDVFNEALANTERLTKEEYAVLFAKSVLDAASRIKTTSQPTPAFEAT